MYSKHIFRGGFGLERETLRVDENGRLARTPHIFDDKFLERDFCENQLEIITPVCQSPQEALNTLGELSYRAENELEKTGEHLWLNSNPPYIENEDEIPVAEFTGENRYKSEYRLKLWRRYGKRLMLYSGIHFNYSFSEEYLRDIQNPAQNFEEFKNNIYLKLFKYASRYSWLMVLLTAASPVYDRSLEEDGLFGTGFDGYASRRNGEKGYWNCFVPALDYSSLKAYTQSVQEYIDRGILFSAGELYLPVRLKPKVENSLESLAVGVNHIELRMFDLNPLAGWGVALEDLEFAQYFLLYLSSLPDFEFSPGLQAQAIANHKACAGFDLDKITVNGRAVKEAALELINDIGEYFKDYDEVQKILSFQRAKLQSGKRYSDIVYRKYSKDFSKQFTKDLTRGGFEVCANFLVPVSGGART